MTIHAFVDESKARGFLLAAALIVPGDLGQARKQVGALRLPGQRRVHFTTERPARRKVIISAMADIDVSVWVYDASACRDQRQAREACLRQLVTDLAAASAQMLVLEQDDSLVDADRRLLYGLVREHGCDTLRYEHKRAHEECLLAIPDAVAWCWAKGGTWQNRARLLVSKTITI